MTQAPSDDTTRERAAQPEPRGESQGAPQSSPQTPSQTARLRDAAGQIGLHPLRDGSWFRRLVANHVKKHLASIRPRHWDSVYPGVGVEERAQRHIARAARRASAAGALASVGASAGEILALVTEGLAAPVGLPMTALSMTVEAAYTTLLQIDLACDLASIYDVPFDVDDVGEVATLFGLAMQVDLKEKEPRLTEPPAREESGGEEGLTAKLIELEEGEIATRIGRKLLEDSIVRNAVPILGIPISARWNYVGTRRLGAAVRRYMRYRRALARACAQLRLESVTDPAVVVEGAWLLCTADGEAGHEEVLALASILSLVPDEPRRAIEVDKSLGDDEEGWFERLALVPQEMHAPLLDALYLVAATDGRLAAAERRFLRRVGKVLERPIDLGRLERLCEHLASGEEIDLLERGAR